MSRKQLVGIQLAGEHAAEFHVGHELFDFCDVAGDALQAVVVIFGERHFHEFAGIIECAFDFLQVEHDTFQHLALASQFLGAFAVLPDGGIFG